MYCDLALHVLNHCPLLCVCLTIFFQSIGRGLKNGENFELLYKLAEKMNAAGKIKTANNYTVHLPFLWY